MKILSRDHVIAVPIWAGEKWFFAPFWGRFPGPSEYLYQVTSILILLTLFLSPKSRCIGPGYLCPHPAIPLLCAAPVRSSHPYRLPDRLQAHPAPPVIVLPALHAVHPFFVHIPIPRSGHSPSVVHRCWELVGSGVRWEPFPLNACCGAAPGAGLHPEFGSRMAPVRLG